jgi:alginate O-acetyltransferase complex protein AlgI
MISELTETTEVKEAVSFRGWIFYDRDCSFCRELALRFENAFAKRGFYFEPLQHEWVQRRLNMTREEALKEMRVLTKTGEVFGGADAVIFLSRRLWWARPLAFLARLPFVHAVLQRLYRWVADHRTCAINNAAAPTFSVRTRWVLLAILPLLTLATKPFLPAWVFMWLMAFAIFFGCKWLTFGNAIRRSGRVCPFRAAAYLFAWPGMDAARFLSPDLAPCASRPGMMKSAALAAVRILLGALLLFAVARQTTEPILAGWIGMAGIILILHFGLFDLASIGWRALRVDAPPIMNRPLGSTSVSEFWGRRWNAAFNDLALRLVFRPVARHTGTVAATLIAFAVSGLIHELVISLPARAGFGLPTGYFLVQGLGVSVEHSSAGKALRLGGGISGWLFTMIVVAGPAYCLFLQRSSGRSSFLSCKQSARYENLASCRRPFALRDPHRERAYTPRA